MNRNRLFLSALLLSGTMTAHGVGAHTSRQEPARAVTKGPASVRHQESHPEAKCERCGSTAGKGQASSHRLPQGKEVHTAKGDRVTSRREDHARELHIPPTVVHHDPDGRREIRVERPDHSVLVASHGGHGYIQRSYSYHGHEFAHRTYYEHGVAYTRVYQPYYYRGIAFHVYAPGFYYAPAFYGWAYGPWAAPVAWEWGWAVHPWYRYYGPWFRPYPIYTSPSLWLTDYLVAQTLEAAYEERAAAAAASRRALLAADFASTPMTLEVKQAIAEEVRRQLALENAEARAGIQNPPDPGSSGLARMLNDRTSHVFVVATGLEVMSSIGACALTEGDVIQLNGPAAPNAVTANLLVLANKGNDCRKGSLVTVGLADLQEMQNHMRETIDRGLRELHSKQGKGGLPAAPPAATKAPVQTEFAAIAPPPDPNGEAEIRQQAADASQAVRR